MYDESERASVWMNLTPIKVIFELDDLPLSQWEGAFCFCPRAGVGADY